MPEVLIVMNSESTREQRDKVVEAVKSSGGRVSLRYPPRVLITRGSVAFAEKIVSPDPRLQGVQAMYSSDQKPFPLDINQVESLKLDANGAIAVRGWIVRQSPIYRTQKASRTFENLHLKEDNIGDIAALGSPAMANLFAVGIIIVNGPDKYGLTPAEVVKVETEIQEGTDWLSNSAPSSANLSFAREYHVVDLDMKPSKAAGEDYWRDPAMERLGFGIGLQAVSKYIADLQERLNADSACVGFITMYNLEGVAYHPRGYEYCVLRYPRSDETSSWRDPNDLDMMFTHEFGHICGGDDEPSGWPTPCVMSQNMAWAVCPSTRAAWQW